MLRSALAWMRATTSGRGCSPNRCAKRRLRPQVVLDRHLPADRRDAGDLAVLGLEDREQARLLGEPGEPDRVCRGAAPAERAGHEHVEVARAAHAPSRARPWPRGRAGRRPSRWRRTGSRAPSRSAARSCPGRTRCRARPPTACVLAVRAAGRRRAGALHAGVHVALVVVADEEHVVVALEHPRQAAEADVDGAAVAALADDADVVAALGPQRRGDARSRRPARCRTASGATAAARTTPGTASRRPRGSRSRWRRPAGRRSRASRRRARSARRAPRRSPGRRGGRR